MLIWLRKAINDRDAQLDYIAEENPLAAIEQGDRIASHVDKLLQHPEMGRAGRKKSTRELVVPRTPFIVVYRLKGDRIEILRVLHGAQQWPKMQK
jgi:toxin ParE1/3/4